MYLFLRRWKKINGTLDWRGTERWDRWILRGTSIDTMISRPWCSIFDGAWRTRMTTAVFFEGTRRRRYIKIRSLATAADVAALREDIGQGETVLASSSVEHTLRPHVSPRKISLRAACVFAGLAFLKITRLYDSCNKTSKMVNGTHTERDGREMVWIFVENIFDSSICLVN